MVETKVLSVGYHEHVLGGRMIFITLARSGKKPTRTMIAESSKFMEQGLKGARW
jgi:hypothetical protein